MSERFYQHSWQLLERSIHEENEFLVELGMGGHMYPWDFTIFFEVDLIVH